uniref:Si:dkeyp-81f3.4 n=2 Tax=Haplochromini TaxID=319058 RepID=A0A3P9BYH2_9CICH
METVQQTIQMTATFIKILLKRGTTMNLTTESAQLVKTLLDRHHRTEKAEMDDIPWAACKDFTVNVGEKQIGAYIKTWELPSCWLYSVDFVCSTEEEHRTFHHYRARFSTPTPRKPIRGTASVYFVVDVSKVKPQTLPVEVSFIVESNKLVHTPGRTRFRENFLCNLAYISLMSLFPFIKNGFLTAPLPFD